MSFSMFAPKHNYGERPGQRTSASFLQRMQEEMYAARGTSADGPLIAEAGPAGTMIGLERVTLDLRRFVLTEDLLAGSFAEAQILIYDNSALTWSITGETFTVWDSLTQRSDGSVLLHEGQYGFAKWFGDNGLWEVVQIGDIISDDFFPARIDARTLDGSIWVYDWTEMEWTSVIAAATVKAGGRTGTNVPRSWPATELNNAIVADDKIVWMRRGFAASSPAVAVVTKTMAGNGAGTAAAFSLYIDDATSGTFTLTFDGSTTAAIAYNATGATVKTAIEAAVTGLTLSAFAGAGTLASPYTFSVTSNAEDHTITANGAALRDTSGYRFEMGEGSAGGLCGWETVPGWEIDGFNSVRIDADGCFLAVQPSECTLPADIFGGTGA